MSTCSVDIPAKILPRNVGHIHANILCISLANITVRVDMMDIENDKVFSLAFCGSYNGNYVDS